MPIDKHPPLRCQLASTHLDHEGQEYHAALDPDGVLVLWSGEHGQYRMKTMDTPAQMARPSEGE